MDAQQDLPFRQLVHKMYPRAKLLHARQLTGGVSAQTTALEIEQADGRTQRVTVRRHGPVDLAHNPHIARDEFRLLEIARSHGLAVPTPLFVDESCDLFPTPVVVIEYIEGESDVEPAHVADYVAQMAEHLAMIHTYPDSPELAFLPRQGRGFGDRGKRIDHTMHEGRIRDALEAAWPIEQRNAATLLHGDYWPGNILWRDGMLAAVIDWEDACVGDPLVDLGNCRMELTMALDGDAAAAFTEAYRARATLDLSNLAYWDLCAALGPCGKLADWDLDPTTEASMRAGHTRFVEQALAALATR